MTRLVNAVNDGILSPKEIDTESGYHYKRFRTAATGFVVEFGTEEFSVALDRE